MTSLSFRLYPQAEPSEDALPGVDSSIPAPPPRKVGTTRGMNAWPDDDITWLSDHEIAFTRSGKGGFGEVWKRDLTTGKDYRFDYLSSFLKKQNAYQGWMYFSPSFQQVLFASPAGITSGAVRQTGKSDAPSPSRPWPFHYFDLGAYFVADPYCWLANREGKDSGRWASLTQDDRSSQITSVTIHNTRSSKSISTLPIQPPIPIDKGLGEPINPLTPAPNNTIIFLNADMVPSSVDALTTMGGPPMVMNTLYVRTIVIDAKVARSHTLVIPIPKTWQKVHPLVSPSGDKIAWDVYVPNTPHAAETQEGRHDPALWKHCLIVSDLEGKRMRLLVTRQPSLSVGIRSAIFFNDSMSSIQWLPDGEHLSFISEKDVFTVPALIMEDFNGPPVIP